MKWIALISFLVLSHTLAFGGLEQNYRCTTGVGTSDFRERFVSITEGQLSVKSKDGKVHFDMKTQSSPTGVITTAGLNNKFNDVTFDRNTKKLTVDSSPSRVYDCKAK